MNQDSVVEYLFLIEHQIFSQEKLLEYLLKIDSLCKVILESDLASYSYSTIFHYFWVISDLARQAIEFNEKLLNNLVKLKLRVDRRDRGPSGGTTEKGGIH